MVSLGLGSELMGLERLPLDTWETAKAVLLLNTKALRWRDN